LAVMQVMKWDIRPDKVEDYLKWSEGAIKRKLAVPGIVEFRSYRGIAGASQVVVTHEFADLASFAAWQSNREIQKIQDELHTFVTNVTTELWGPSPVVPTPLRPKKNRLGPAL
jgi:antibiotic biosynthesis monooxygenase (ABM) superfamily enzyme